MNTTRSTLRSNARPRSLSEISLELRRQQVLEVDGIKVDVSNLVGRHHCAVSGHLQTRQPKFERSKSYTEPSLYPDVKTFLQKEEEQTAKRKCWIKSRSSAGGGHRHSSELSSNLPNDLPKELPTGRDDSSCVSSLQDSVIDATARPPAPSRDPNPSKRVYDRAQAEVMPGYTVPLVGSEETLQALKHGYIRHVECAACISALSCHWDATLIVCPTCRILSPTGYDGDPCLGLGILQEYPATNYKGIHEVMQQKAVASKSVDRTFLRKPAPSKYAHEDDLTASNHSLGPRAA